MSYLGCNDEIFVDSEGACVDETVDYSISFNGNTFWDEGTVSWSFENGETSDDHSPEVIYNSAGEYSYTLDVTTPIGCTYTITGTTVISNPLPPPDLLHHYYLCEDDTLTVSFDEFSEWPSITDETGAEVTSYTFTEAGVYNFYFTSPCSQFDEEIIIDVPTEENLYFVAEENLCLGSELVIFFPEWDSISSQSDLTISFGDGHDEVVDSDSIIYTYTNSGTYAVEIFGTLFGCPVSDQINVTIDPPLTSFVSDSILLCNDQTEILDFDDFPFTVTDASGNILSSYDLTQGGQYIFTAFNACGQFTDTLNVTRIDIQPQPYNVSSTICEGKDTVTFGFSSDDYMYFWESGASSPSITSSLSGEYSVTVTDSAELCASDYSFVVNARPPSETPIFDDDEIVFCREGQRILTPNPIDYTYQFSDDQEGDSFIVSNPGWITASYSDGCFNYSDSIWVSLIKCLCPIEMPNVFTPNGDGKNEVLLPFIDCPVYQYEFRVFNRWGRELFLSRDERIGWPGDMSGESASEGVYYYILNCYQQVDEESFPISLSGHFSLLR